MQNIRNEIVGDLTNLGNELTLAPSLLLIGGRLWQTSSIVQASPVLDTGALAASEFYYTYAVINAGLSIGLVSSLSPIKPDGFSAHRKVGGFFTDSNGDIFLTLIYEDRNRIGTIAKVSEFSAEVNGQISPSPVTQKNANWVEGDCTRTASGEYRCDFVPGTFLSPPNCTAIRFLDFTSVGENFSNMGTGQTTKDSVHFFSETGSDVSFKIFCLRAGIDYRTTEDKDWNLY